MESKYHRENTTMNIYIRIILSLIWWVIAAVVITIVTDNDYGNTGSIAMCTLTITLPFLVILSGKKR